MATRKTLIKARAWVRLQPLEPLARRQVLRSSWRLSTRRRKPARTLADAIKAEAGQAFDKEAIA